MFGAIGIPYAFTDRSHCANALLLFAFTNVSASLEMSHGAYTSLVGHVAHGHCGRVG